MNALFAHSEVCQLAVPLVVQQHVVQLQVPKMRIIQSQLRAWSSPTQMQPPSQASAAQSATWTNLIIIKKINKSHAGEVFFCFISYKREGGRSIILPMAFNVGRCCRSLPTWVSKHITSLACRVPAHLALGLTGAEVARAVRSCKDDAAKCCAWTTLIQHSCTGADTGAGEQNKASAEEKHIPYSPQVLGFQSQILLLSA